MINGGIKENWSLSDSSCWLGKIGDGFVQGEPWPEVSSSLEMAMDKEEAWVRRQRGRGGHPLWKDSYGFSFLVQTVVCWGGTLSVGVRIEEGVSVQIIIEGIGVSDYWKQILIILQNSQQYWVYLDSANNNSQHFLMFIM